MQENMAVSRSANDDYYNFFGATMSALYWCAAVL